MHSPLEIVEGQVLADDEHLSLSYGSVDTAEPPLPTVARVSAPVEGIVTLELLIDGSTTNHEEISAEVRRQVHWLFVEKGEPSPWVYARYHSTTSANIYSLVHWSWVPAQTTRPPN